MAVIFKDGHWVQDNDPLTTLESSNTPSSLQGTSGPNPFLSGEAMSGYAALIGAALQADANNQRLKEGRRLQENARMEQAGDSLSEILMRRGSNAFTKNASEANAILTILSKLR
jgi:hypothetical protein